MNKSVPISILLLASLFAVQALKAQPTIVATIKPVQLIAQAITTQVSDVGLLLASNQDPHNVSLKPSQRQLLDEAKIVVWIGPELEQGLGKVISDKEGKPQSIIQWTQLEGAELIRVQESIDPHLWLSSHNVLLLASKIAEELSKRDLINADRYQHNLEVFETKLEQANKIIFEDLSTEIANPYAVYHNAFVYFEKEIGQNHVLSISDNEEIQPGIRRLLEVRKSLEQTRTRCLLIEPGVNIQQLQNVLANETIDFVEVDVLGHDIIPSQDGYIRLKKEIADGFKQCLH